MERIRKKYFRNYELMGYWILNGEMPEGMYIYEQGICRYTAGYAQFYEKNESMLAYMLDFNGGNPEPEVVDWTKYDTVRKQQEERRNKGNSTINDRSVNGESPVSEGISENERKELNSVWNENARAAGKSVGRMKFTAAVVFALLCMIGVANINDAIETDNLKASIQGVLGGVYEEKKNDVTEVSAASVITAAEPETETTDNNTDAGRLVAQDKLADAVLNENNPVQYEAGDGETVQEQDKQEIAETSATADAAVADGVQSSEQTEQQSYIIKKGDTLLEISIRQYGDAARIKEICSLNDIDDPDDIKVGQKIFLP
jgi:LysM repeat protein